MSRLNRTTDGPVARITLADPGRLNALSTGMIGELQTAFDAIGQDRSIRVVILAAQGKAFCAGHDIKEMQAARAAEDGGLADFSALFDSCTRLMTTIQALPQPVIAEVQGVATAAGCQLVATCDMAIAASTARFGVNGVDIGLFCSTPMVALTRAIPRKAAFEMLVTGRMIDAEEARALGLINGHVAAEDLSRETEALATRVASKLSAAVKLGKRAFYDQAALPTAEAYRLTGEVIVGNLMQADTREGMQAFIEKRPPAYQEP